MWIIDVNYDFVVTGMSVYIRGVEVKVVEGEDLYDVQFYIIYHHSSAHHVKTTNSKHLSIQKITQYVTP